MDDSRITVIIPSYNREDRIAVAVKSLFAQTDLPYEIIVVDDGSTDNTKCVIEALQAQAPTKLSYHLKENGGPSSARNYGIRKCSTQFIAFLDSDDEWISDKLRLQLELFKESPYRANLGVVYCDFELIDGLGNRLLSSCSSFIDPSLRGNIFVPLLDCNKVTSSCSGVLVKKECFDKVGLFDEKLGAAEDWDMWLRIAEAYDFDFVDKVLVKIRRHTGNMQLNVERMFQNELIFMSKWTMTLNQIEIPPSWPQKIADTIIQQLPNTNLYRDLIKITTPEIERKLFFRTDGSVRKAIFSQLKFKVYLEFRGWAKVIILGTFNLVKLAIKCLRSALLISLVDKNDV